MVWSVGGGGAWWSTVLKQGVCHSKSHYVKANIKSRRQRNAHFTPQNPLLPQQLQQPTQPTGRISSFDDDATLTLIARCTRVTAGYHGGDTISIVICKLYLSSYIISTTCTMFASSNNSGLSVTGTIDEFELDHIPEDDHQYDDGDNDDGTEISQSYFPNYSIMPSPSHAASDTLGTVIRVEGWLNHTSSSSSKMHHRATSSTSLLSKKSKQTKQPRYFVLRGDTLSYYAQRHDVKAKGTFVLTKGCTVSPVVFGSLEDTMAASGDQDADDVASPMSPSEDALDGNQTTSTSTAMTKSKKKKQQYYCVRVTWPINNKLSKDEKYMAQAKAQVAAESEKEAMQQQQQIQQQLMLGEGGDHANIPTLNQTKSPSSKSLLHRTRPSHSRQTSGGSVSIHASPKSPFRKAPAIHAHIIHNAPVPPNLDDEDIDAKENNTAAILPTVNISTALTGVNAFNRNTSDASKDFQETDATNPSSLNHETGLHKHYTQQIEKHAKDQQKSQEELQKVMVLLSRKASHQKNKKRFIQGTKVAAVSTAAITAGVLTAGIGLAAGLVFVGITAAAGGSGAVVGGKVYDKAKGKYYQKESQKSFRLIVGANSYEEAMKWKQAMEYVIQELVLTSQEDDVEEMDLESWKIRASLSTEGEVGVDRAGNAAMSPIASNHLPPISPGAGHMNNANTSTPYLDLTPRWVPIQGGGVALWGVLGSLGGGGNLRIYREERLHTASSWFASDPPTSAFPTIPRFRSDVGLAGQPFPPLKASLVLKTNSLDAFMCLMCSGRILNNTLLSGREGSPMVIPVPNSGQIASFRIIETMDDHMDVIHLVFRPLYLFPSWTAPRDFLLYRFWKYDDDGSYQICFESGEHRDCPPFTGYVRGEMHSVYTIAPLKRRKRQSSSKQAANIINEECLMSHTVQVDPRGWVPTTSSVPFVRNQGYGDAFAIMALHQMLDVKEALDQYRFVAVPTDDNPSLGGQSKQMKHPKRLFARNGLVRPKVGRATSGGSVKGGIYMPTLEVCESAEADVSDDELDVQNYDFKYSDAELPRRESEFSLDGHNHNASVRIDSVAATTNNTTSTSASPTISTHPPPTL